ncbi:MAG: endonuclease III [Gemmatimonadota bacterium]|nr:MAG: endonuclease III [Gemmatimonadota bacterium]
MVTTETKSPPLRRRVRALLRRLEREYGKARRERTAPIDELILTILSQNTSDGNRDRAYDSLRARFSSWEALRLAPRSEVEDAIRPAGLWKQKARVLQDTLNALHDEHGRLDLSHLESLSDAEIIDYLTGHRGIGVKTAACVLCFSLGRPYMPVDTHVHRLARRLGLIPAEVNADRAHELLNSKPAVPPELRFSFHIQLIRHGRRVCRAARPACDSCILNDLCPKLDVD